MASSENNKSFFNDLWDRRFFQFLATYVGVSWGILQFLQFACTRYEWDSSYIDKFLLIVAIMLPSVIIFIYNHGRPGDDEWKSYEKWLIPVNFLVALGATFFIGSAGATAPDGKIEYESEKLVLVDEDGEEITRNVPKSETSLSIVLFPMMIKSEKTDIDWLRLTPVLLGIELSQDVRLSTISPFSLGYEYKNYDFKLEDDIPLGTKVKIAKDNYAEHFITSTVKEVPEGLAIDMILYKTEDGKELFRKEYINKTIYDIYDEISIDVNDHLYTASYLEKESIPDLPAANLISSNPETLKKYLEARKLASENDTEGAVRAMAEGVEIDPSCSLCHSLLGQFYSVSDIEKAQKSMKKAVNLSSGISERQQFYTKYYNYQVNLQPEKGVKLLNLWKSLYPSDKNPFKMLLDRHRLTRNYNKAIQVGEEAVAKGHAGSILPILAELSMKTGDLDAAKSYLEKFAGLYPDKSEQNGMLGDLYIKTGDLEKAKELYTDMSILNGNDHRVLLKLAALNEKLGEYDEAMAFYNEAYAAAGQLRDSLDIKNEVAKHYLRRGMAKKALETGKEMIEGYRTILPPLLVDGQIWLQMGPMYHYADSLDSFEAQISTKFPGDDQQASFMRSLALFLVSMMKDDVKVLDEKYAIVKPMLLNTIGPAFDNFIQGYSAYLKGDYELGEEYVQSYVDSTGVDFETTGESVYEIYLANKSYDKLSAYIDSVLKSDPSHPTSLLFKAKMLNAEGNDDQAKEVLDRVLTLYADADENYRFYREARELEKEI